jgi:hypothetical protein
MPGIEYDVTGHILLSAEAAALDPDALRAHNLEAELVLGLPGTAYTGTDREKALIAVVQRVNYQLANPSARASNVKSETEGERSFTYVTSADQAGGAAAAPIEPQEAVLIVQGLRMNNPANWL